MRLVISNDKPVFQVIYNANPQLSPPKGKLKLVVDNKRIIVKMRLVKGSKPQPQPLKLVVNREKSLFDKLEEMYSDNYSFRCNETLS